MISETEAYFVSEYLIEENLVKVEEEKFDIEHRDKKVFYSEKNEIETELVEVQYSFESDKVQSLENCSSLEACLKQELTSIEIYKNEDLFSIDPVESELAKRNGKK